MNDNDHLGEYGVPEWACEIVENHDLGLRADDPLSAAIVLLTDAAAALHWVNAAAFQEQAVSLVVLRRLEEIIVMVEDARKLARICPREPSVGTVTASTDGTLLWSPTAP